MTSSSSPLTNTAINSTAHTPPEIRNSGSHESTALENGESRASSALSQNPTQLFVGNQETLHDYTVEYLQKQLCPHKGCFTCVACKNILNKQHHALRWFTPEKQYTKEELAPLFHLLSFALDQDQQFFIIIECADLLTAACANSLLKSLEEPPAGYRFLLLTDHADQILPTIRSRCAVHTIQTTHTQTISDPLFSIFSKTTLTDSAAFLKILDKEKPTEQRSMALVHVLLGHWITAYKKALSHTNFDTGSSSSTNFNSASPSSLSPHTIYKIITLFTAAIKHPPMPGASKLMWKNIYLQFQLQVK
jgi:hypothetical protein